MPSTEPASVSEHGFVNGVLIALSIISHATQFSQRLLVGRQGLLCRLDGTGTRSQNNKNAQTYQHHY